MMTNVTRTPKPDDFEPLQEFPEDHHNYGRPRCTAWSPKRGRQCLGIAMAGTGKCRFHGGASLKGIAATKFKDGKYSKYIQKLPDRNKASYQNAINNPEILRLNEEIALIDTRLIELTGQLDGSSSSQIFNKLKAEMESFQDENQKVNQARYIKDEKKREEEIDKHRAKASRHLINVQNLIEEGSKDYWKWQDITRMIENRRRLVETERKLLMDMQLLVSVENVGIQLDRLLESIRRHVSDRDTLQAIQTEFIKLSS